MGFGDLMYAALISPGGDKDRILAVSTECHKASIALSDIVYDLNLTAGEVISTWKGETGAGFENHWTQFREKATEYSAVLENASQQMEKIAIAIADVQRQALINRIILGATVAEAIVGTVFTFGLSDVAEGALLATLWARMAAIVAREAGTLMELAALAARTLSQLKPFFVKQMLLIGLFGMGVSTISSALVKALRHQNIFDANSWTPEDVGNILLGGTIAGLLGPASGLGRLPEFFGGTIPQKALTFGGAGFFGGFFGSFTVQVWFDQKPLDGETLKRAVVSGVVAGASGALIGVGGGIVSNFAGKLTRNTFDLNTLSKTGNLLPAKAAMSELVATRDLSEVEGIDPLGLDPAARTAHGTAGTLPPGDLGRRAEGTTAADPLLGDDPLISPHAVPPNIMPAMDDTPPLPGQLTVVKLEGPLISHPPMFTWGDVGRTVTGLPAGMFYYFFNVDGPRIPASAASPAPPAGSLPAAPDAPVPGVPPPMLPPAVIPGGPYTIQPNDTFWDIAGRRLGDPTLWPLLKVTNPQFDPNNLPPGGVIEVPSVLPPTPPPALPQHTHIHKVQDHDTVWSLGHGDPDLMDRIAELNHLADRRVIHARDWLIVPDE